VLVSNFTIGQGSEMGARRSVYCLQITNLEAVDVEFLFECFVTPAATAGGDPETTPITKGETGFASTYFEATQVSSTPGPLRFSQYGSSARGQTRVPVPAGLSRRVRLWSDSRLSGYVTLRVPASRRPGGFALTRQLRELVHVLLHASHESYRPSRPLLPLVNADDEDVASSIGGDKSSAAVALASGKAENEIEAEGWSVSGVADFVASLRDGAFDEDDLRGGSDVPDDQRVVAMLDLLSGLDASREELEQINQLLAESEASVRLESS
jgi:hypothetical protein